MPFIWIVILVLTGIFLKNRVWRKRLWITALVCFFIFSNSIIFDEFMRVWEVDGKTYEEVEYHDVGIVPGGMASFNKDLDRISFRYGSDRIMQALKLYKMGKIGKIMICGDSGRLYDDGLDEAAQIRAYLIAIGIDENDIIVETESKNTHENAAFAARILEKEYPEYTRFLLITSAFHMRRTKSCFEKEGISVTTFSTDHYTGKRWFNFDRLFIPNIETLASWNILTKEWTGYVMYAAMGYL